MKHSVFLTLLLAILPLSFISCVDDPEYADTPEGNFDAL